MTQPAQVMSGGLTLWPVADAVEITMTGAAWLADAINRIVVARGRCVLAVSGGRSPWPMFERLVETPGVPWAHVHVIQVDERAAPDGHQDRNWTSAQQVFGSVLPAEQLHPMPVTSDDPVAAAADYGRLIDRLCDGEIDIVHLGLGPDGHTASLFPDDPIMSVVDRAVAWTTYEHMGRLRMSVTLPTLARAQNVMWQIGGFDKHMMLTRLLEGDGEIPAGRVRRDRAVVIADAAALGTQG